MQYSKYVQQMIDETMEKSRQMEGWEPEEKVVDEESIGKFNSWLDPWNPIYNDREYGAKTRWGGTLVFPLLPLEFAETIHTPVMDPAGGYLFSMYAGENYEFYKPIRLGDTLRIFHRPSVLEDITDRAESCSPEVKGWKETGIPIFKFVEVDADFYNQDNELVMSMQHLNDISILPEPRLADTAGLPFEPHVYTEEELEYIQSIIDGEEIRGSTPRYWEDVQIGDSVKPVSLGPTNLWDMAAFYGALPRIRGNFCLRRMREVTPHMVFHDDANNYYKPLLGYHFYDNELAAGGGVPGCFLFGNTAGYQMGRLVSNWMGDDGELRRMKWRHMKLTQIGDCNVVRGRVLDKRVENGEHIVEIDAWVENLCRGNVSESGRITVSLPTRQEVRK